MKGYYDPIRGYFETNVEVDRQGVVEVPLQPSSEHEWQNGEWTRVAQTPPTPEELRAYNAGKRWHVETAGFSFNGMKIATDDRSKLMITGARIKADNDPAFETNWKATDGSFITLNASMIIAISDAVLAHVDACFTQEQAVKDGIDSGYIANIEDIDAVWELMA